MLDTLHEYLTFWNIWFGMTSLAIFLFMWSETGANWEGVEVIEVEDTQPITEPVCSMP